jgi:RecA/RadA recombinase
MSTESPAEIAKKAINISRPKLQISSKDLLSTGSTLLNCAMSGKPDGGLIKGKYFFFVGDSGSAKTFITLTCLAEASINLNFKGYRLIHDNVEDGALMDFEHYFGNALKNRIEPPEKDKHGDPVYSSTIEELYFHIDDAIKKKTPFIYILDSMDSLSTEPEQEKFEEIKEAYIKGKKTTGSYGMDKAKTNSYYLRTVVLPGLKKTGSILLIISQTRDNVGFGFEKRTRSGGRALRFYATCELWTSVKEKIKKSVRGQLRQIGVLCKIDIKKNRETGKERTVEIPVVNGIGIDDIGSCVDYLIEEKYWKKAKNSKGEEVETDEEATEDEGKKSKKKAIYSPEFSFTGSRDKLVEKIEIEGGEKQLRMLVGQVWNQIEEECTLLNRKRRY